MAEGGSTHGRDAAPKEESVITSLSDTLWWDPTTSGFSCFRNSGNCNLADNLFFSCPDKSCCLSRGKDKKVSNYATRVCSTSTLLGLLASQYPAVRIKLTRKRSEMIVIELTGYAWFQLISRFNWRALASQSRSSRLESSRNWTMESFLIILKCCEGVWVSFGKSSAMEKIESLRMASREASLIWLSFTQSW